MRQLHKPFQVVGRELRARPVDCRFRNGIEIVRGINQWPLCRDFREWFGRLAREFSMLLRFGIGAVANHVAQAHNSLQRPCAGSQSGFQSSGIRVQIAKNKNPHS